MLLVRRGGCTFVTKAWSCLVLLWPNFCEVRIAQEKGAHAVIVVGLLESLAPWLRWIEIRQQHRALISRRLCLWHVTSQECLPLQVTHQSSNFRSAAGLSNSLRTSKSMCIPGTGCQVMSGDGWGDSVKIPSMMVSRQRGRDREGSVFES